MAIDQSTIALARRRDRATRPCGGLVLLAAEAGLIGRQDHRRRLIREGPRACSAVAVGPNMAL